MAELPPVGLPRSQRNRRHRHLSAPLGLVRTHYTTYAPSACALGLVRTQRMLPVASPMGPVIYSTIAVSNANSNNYTIT